MQPSRSLVAIIAILIMLAGCGSADGSEPSPSPTSSTGPSSPAPSPSIPADGVTLQELGFENGPTDRLSLPRGVSLRTSADQPNAVTLVFEHPPADQIADYLRRTLPQAGFKIDSDLGSTIIFSGFGWSGSFTGAAGSSALVIRTS